MKDTDFFGTLSGKISGRKGATLKRWKHIGDKSTIARTIQGQIAFPEVMIKIVSSAKDKANTHRLVDYISKKGELEVENGNGLVFNGRAENRLALYGWDNLPDEPVPRYQGAGGHVQKFDKHGEPIPPQMLRQTLHVVFSMRKGTPKEEVRRAVRDFAKVEFSNHQYLFAMHSDGHPPHPHVHVLVNMKSMVSDARLNPDRDDLQRWREVFAERLRAHGIDCNATPRAARGISTKKLKGAVFEIDKRYRAWVDAGSVGEAPPISKRTQEAISQAREEVDGKPRAEMPVIRTRLQIQRQNVIDEYREAADEFRAEGDAELASKIDAYIASFAPVTNAHDEKVKAMAEIRDRPAEKDQDKQAERGHGLSM